MAAGALCTGLRTTLRLDHTIIQHQDRGLEVMKANEISDCYHRAEKELQPVFDFINAGNITPNDGCISYLYAIARIRANEAQRANQNLRISAWQYAKEKENIECRQNQEN
jgi:hypothetical protein